MDPALERIDKLTEKAYSLVYFESVRSAHITDLFKSLSLASSKAIYHWTPDNGLYRMDASHIMIPRSQTPRHLLELIHGTPHFGVYLLSQFDEALKEQHNVDMLKKIIAGYNSNPKMIILLGNQMDIPADLRPSVAHIRHTLHSSQTDSSRKAS
ncbi:hypothetical protein [Sulfuriflexus mobilis]|uniref:hypothetical protein n=1 Tax=Sulfuriflexus mobilis TaxID=1811807 RepID=UPI000F844CCA|nr:hypothetical protein [Sulfuriflexus mobilis]